MSQRLKETGAKLGSAKTRLALVLASFGYAALLVLLRGRPSVESDAGVFLSVAGRLLRGDRLYVNVIDNKDPLFFYAHAIALDVFGWSGPFLLDVIWVAIAAAGTLLLLRAVGASWLVSAISFLVYPVLLTGAWYNAGYSLLAALSFAPMIGYLWMRGDLVLAGALFALGFLFKVNLALILASVPLAILVFRLTPRPVVNQLVKAAIGFAGVLAAAVIVLAVRGELHGYLNNLVENVSYSHAVLAATGHTSSVIGHVEIAAWAASQPVHFAGVPVNKALHLGVFTLVFVLVVLLAIRTLWPGKGASEQLPARDREDRAPRALAAIFLSATVTTAVTLALTAAWFVHDETLAFPASMLIAFVAVRVPPRLGNLPRAVPAIAVACVGLVLLGGTAGAGRAKGSISAWFHEGHSETAQLLERAASTLFPGAREVTFAHLGQNDEDAVGAFLASRFSLSCPRIAQYVFTPHLDDTLRCVREKQPKLVLVTAKFKPIPGAPASWNQFVADGSNLLRNSYERVSTTRTINGSASVWVLARSHATTGASR
jgi:hypothetical protein